MRGATPLHPPPPPPPLLTPPLPLTPPPRFWLKNNGILFENEVLQIGIKSEYKKNLGRVGVFYGNKTKNALSGFSTTITSGADILSRVYGGGGFWWGVWRCGGFWWGVWRCGGLLVGGLEVSTVAGTLGFYGDMEWPYDGYIIWPLLFALTCMYS